MSEQSLITTPAPSERRLFQRCFRAIVGLDERLVEDLRRQRRSAAARLGAARRRAHPDVLDERKTWPPPWWFVDQLDLWPELRGPATGPGHPRSLFARRGLSRAEVAWGKLVVDDGPPPWVASRVACLGRDVPCPFVRCRHHNEIEVNEIGSVKLTHPNWTAVDLAHETCSLEVARRGPQTVETVARILNISTERVRQIQRAAERKVRLRLAVLREE